MPARAGGDQLQDERTSPCAFPGARVKHSMLVSILFALIRQDLTRSCDSWGLTGAFPYWDGHVAMADPREHGELRAERERVDAASADAAQRLREKVMCGLSCKARPCAPAAIVLWSKLRVWTLLLERLNHIS